MQYLILLGVLLTGVLYAAALVLGRRRRLREYRKRPCSGRQWQRRFPDSPKQDIRSFLDSFTNAFGLPSRERLRFDPSDRLIDVYRALHPPGGIVDEMEFERLAIKLEDQYGTDAAVLTSPELTLGELFEEIRHSPWNVKKGTFYFFE